MKLKIICFILVPLFAFCFVFPLPASAAAAGAVVTVGEAMTSMEIFDFLVESGLIDVDDLHPGDFFTPSVFLRTVSGTLDYLNVPKDQIPGWLNRLFDVNNQLFWNEDKTGVVQQHNGEIVPIDDIGDIWYKSDNMPDCGYIPINYSFQLDGNMYSTGGYTYNMVKLAASAKPLYGSNYMLPIIVSGGNLFYSSYILANNFMGFDYYHQFYHLDGLTPVGSSEKFTLNPNNTAGSSSSFKVGTCANDPSRFYFWATYLSDQDKYQSFSSTTLWNAAGNSWRSSRTNEVVTLQNGDISYLIYHSDPITVPSDFPSGNFVTNPYPLTPEKFKDTIIYSPDNDYGNLFDFLQNGFQFTGKIEQTIDSTIKFSGSVSADINANHSGNVSINITYPDQQFWADDGSATDFGNGVTLDGNSFNDGFNWLIDSIKAVPAVLASFTFIPAPVIAIMSAALVCMVFLGFWRTFKGGS